MADTIQGLTIGLGLNTAGLDESLKSLRAKLKYMNSEMAANMSAFDRGEKSVQKYQTQLGGLNRKLQVQRDATAAARTEYERMVAQHGEGSVQAQRAATAYNNEVAAVNNLERHVENLTEEMQQFQAQQEAANSTMGRLSTSLTTAGGHMKKFGDGMKTAGKNMSMYVTAPLVGLGAASVKTAMEFEAQMSRVGAIAGSTGAELDAMKEQALELGASTSKSASEVAIGMENLAAMGFDVNEVMGAMPGVIAAAESSGADMAQTADVMASALNVFGLEASDATKVADILAQTANQSAADITDMQYALKYAGGPAAALGVSLEELSASIGIMTDAGLTGENAGTALRGALLGLLDPSEENSKMMDKMGIAITDNEGNFVGLSKLVDNLGKSMEGQTETQKAATLSALVGKEAVSGMLSLMSAGPADIDRMTKSLEESGGASAETAAKMKDNLAGAIDELGGAFETAAITIGTTLTPAVHKVTGFIQGLLEKFQGMSPEGQRAAVMFAGLAAAAGPVLVGLGFMVSALGSVVTFLGSAAGAISIMGTGVAASTPLIGGLATAFTVLTGPVGIAAAAIAGIGIATGLLVNHLKKDALPEVDRFGNGVSESTQKALGGFFELSDGASQELSTMSITSQEITGEMADNLVGKFAEMNTQILDGMKKRHADELKEMETQFLNSSALTAEREEEIMRQEKIRNEMEVVEQSHFQDRIKEIMDAAASEKRELTEIEKETINSIQEEMNKNAVQYLTDNERDQKIILENMKNQADELSTQQAAAVVKNSAKQRDEVIADADKTYNDTIAFAIQQRDEAGTISAEEAKKIIDEAKKKRDTTVGHAKGMHEEVVGEAKKQAKGHIDQVNWETGETLSKWEVYKNNVVRKFNEQKDSVVSAAKTMGRGIQDATESAKTISTALWNTFKNNVVTKFTEMKDEAKERFEDLVQAGKDLPGRIGKGISSMASKVSDGVKAVSNKLASGLGTGVNGVIGGINWVLGKIGSDSRVPKWEVPKYAHGTKGHPGGLAILGDGRGSNAGRELIQTPSGELSLSPAKDTLMSLPKGAQVLSAKKTKELLGDIPKYANGIGDMLGDLWNGAKGLGKKAVSAAFDVWDYVKNPSKLLNVALGALGISAPAGGSLAGNMAKAGYNKVKDGAVDYVKKKLADFESSAPMAGSGNGFGSPFRLTSRRGMRFHPVTKKWAMHQGDDWGAPAGTLIPAQAAGRVVQSGFHNIRGNYVRVKSGIMERIYQHNTKNLVGVGQNVRKGQAVGTVGSTGRSTGPHLHYEVKKNGVNINPFGLATGGITTGLTASTLHEEGYPEIVIPTAPKRRTDAMKLLAIAGKKIMGNDSSVIRPNQLPNTPSSNGDDSGGVLKALLAATMKQNEILMQLLQKDGNLYMDTGALVGVVGPELEQWNGSNSSIKMQQKGW